MSPPSELDALPTVEGLSYPFDRHGLATEERAWVDAELSDLQSRFGLFEDPAKSCSAVRGFAAACSVPGLPEETVRLTVELLSLIIYFNDRVGESDSLELLDHSLAALLDPRRARGDAPSTLASADLGTRLAPHLSRVPENTVAFLEATVDTWTAFRWESEHLRALPEELSDYEQLRMQTIAVQPFLRCFRLLMGLPAEAFYRNAQLLRTAEVLSTRVQYLANDLGSVSRDLARHQRNSVLLTAKQCELPLAVAWQQVRARHDRDAEALHASLTRLREREQDPALRRFVEELEACTWGNLLALTRLAKRYRRVAPEL